MRLRPLEIGDLLDETFRMYRRHFFLFAGISVILAIPFAALAGYSVFAFFGNFLQQLAAGATPDMTIFGQSIVIYGVGILLNLALYPLLFAISFLTSAIASGASATWRRGTGSWRRSRPRSAP